MKSELVQLKLNINRFYEVNTKWASVRDSIPIEEGTRAFTSISGGLRDLMKVIETFIKQLCIKMDRPKNKMKAGIIQ